MNNKNRRAQYYKEYRKRVRNECDISGGTEERRARDAAYRKEYRARKKEENMNTLRHIRNTQQNNEASLATSNHIATSQLFITEMKSVYSAVRTGSLNKAVCACSVFI
jgi:hypothetical protein